MEIWLNQRTKLNSPQSGKVIDIWIQEQIQIYTYSEEIWIPLKKVNLPVLELDYFDNDFDQLNSDKI